jgi:tetratricopeptide (TPR) repeat protein
MIETLETSRRHTLSWIAMAAVGGMMAAAVPHLLHRSVPQAEAPTTIGAPVGLGGSASTSPDGLRQRIDEMEERLRNQPRDAGAAVLLADALLRQARATTDSRPASRAEVVLTAVLRDTPSHYDALRMLGAIYLSEHRFREAADIGRRAHNLRPDDAWNYGVMGDALLELGDYDAAFDAFDKAASTRPSATAYARIAYGRELRGDLDGALLAMQMAGQATPPQDAEAGAWYAAQVGELWLKMGRLAEAEREYRRAAFLFPNYPHATVGEAKVKLARGDHDGALSMYLEQFTRTPTLDLAWRIGDLYAERHERDESERYYQLAEDLAGPAAAQTEVNLALFLAEHGRKLPEAVAIAEHVAAARHDIFTEDALAWAYYKTGRLAEAVTTSERAERTGTHDERIRSHAAAIRVAVNGGVRHP